MDILKYSATSLRISHNKSNFCTFLPFTMSNQDNLTHINDQQAVTLLRRLGAIFYDSFLLLTVLFVASIIAVIPTGIKPEDPYFFLFQLYIFAIAYLFFAWCWTRGGQTLGMRTWKIKLVNEDGSRVRWSTSLLRYAVAIISWLALGLGFLWALWDKKNRTWHDMVSKTKLIRI